MFAVAITGSLQEGGRGREAEEWGMRRDGEKEKENSRREGNGELVWWSPPLPDITCKVLFYAWHGHFVLSSTKSHKQVFKMLARQHTR